MSRWTLYCFLIVGLLCCTYRSRAEYHNWSWETPEHEVCLHPWTYDTQQRCFKITPKNSRRNPTPLLASPAADHSTTVATPPQKCPEIIAGGAEVARLGQGQGQDTLSRDRGIVTARYGICTHTGEFPSTPTRQVHLYITSHFLPPGLKKILDHPHPTFTDAGSTGGFDSFYAFELTVSTIWGSEMVRFANLKVAKDCSY
jgi:hypothetical protein